MMHPVLSLGVANEAARLHHAARRRDGRVAARTAELVRASPDVIFACFAVRPHLPWRTAS
jgi:hypothetical protein